MSQLERPGHGWRWDVLDSGNESADEAQVDECDEARIGRRAVVREEREDGPCESEDRHDEEHEDRGRSQGVDFRVLVNEPGEHAHGRDLDHGAFQLVSFYCPLCCAGRRTDV